MFIAGFSCQLGVFNLAVLNYISNSSFSKSNIFKRKCWHIEYFNNWTKSYNVYFVNILGFQFIIFSINYNRECLHAVYFNIWTLNHTMVFSIGIVYILSSSELWSTFYFYPHYICNLSMISAYHSIILQFISHDEIVYILFTLISELRDWQTIAYIRFRTVTIYPTSSQTMT